MKESLGRAYAMANVPYDDNIGLYIDAIYHEDFSHYSTVSGLFIFNDGSKIHISSIKKEHIDGRKKRIPLDTLGTPLPEHVAECFPSNVDTSICLGNRIGRFIRSSDAINKDQLKAGIALLKAEYRIQYLSYDGINDQWRIIVGNDYRICKGDITMFPHIPIICCILIDTTKCNTQHLFDAFQITEKKLLCTHNHTLFLSDSIAEDYYVFDNGMTITHYPVREQREKEMFYVFLPMSHQVCDINTSKFSEVKIGTEGKYIVISATK